MHSCFWLWISPLLSPEYGANKMLFSGHFQKCLTQVFGKKFWVQGQPRGALFLDWG